VVRTPNLLISYFLDIDKTQNFLNILKIIKSFLKKFFPGDEIFEYSSPKIEPEPINYRQALVKNLSIDDRLKNLECEIKEEKKKKMRGTRGGKKIRKRNLKKQNENI